MSEVDVSSPNRDDRTLAGARVVVTGASRGVGAALAARAVLREVVEQDLLDGTPVAVVVAGAVEIGR